MEKTVPIRFEPRGGWFAAALPRGSPEELREVLARVRFCVPAPAPDFPGLLLCDEARYRDWLNTVDAIPGRGICRMVQLLSMYLEHPDPLQIRISAPLLRFAGIDGPARLRPLTDGSVLITPDHNENKKGES